MPASLEGQSVDRLRRRRTPFELQVRGALVHLYDLPHLRTHPLLGLLPELAGLTPSRAAEALHERLLSTLAAVRQAHGLSASAAQRRHRLMEMRYDEGVELNEVCPAI